MNHEKSNQKINRRKFLKRGIATGFISGGALLLGQSDILASSLISPTEPKWQITVDGKVVKEGTFTDETYNFYIPVKNGTAHVVINGSRIFVHEENDICEKKICSKMGSIQKSGEAITCLPNKLVVRVI
ncbi:MULTISPECIES: NusG domain II-containing protein [Bacillus]|uniref:NusG domain II-containing protein n=1 Tax=Bacillus TaxID=1386 RepID=UPI0002E93291|nr:MULTISPECIES: NusG domain II-containing protein [Bacillus]